jgi:mono/diheme cytochrome c family protein
VLIGFAAGAALMLSACHGPEEPFVVPDKVEDFAQLYKENCAGCHGPDGHHGAARPLNSGLYQGLVTKENLIETISKGRYPAAMPAFAKSAGGSLTDKQVEILATEMQKQWAKPQEIAGAALPPFAAPPGDPARGQATFQTYCASCHEGKGTGGSITDPNFLALVTDQGLRSAIIAGRPEDGAPDYRNNVQGHPMQPQEISDVVAWLASQRPAYAMNKPQSPKGESK